MSAGQMRHSTDDLIHSLALDLRPTPRFAVPLRIAAGVAAGCLVSALFLLIAIGTRPDLAAVVSSGAFWAKVAYSLGTAATALFVSARLSRPGAKLRVAWLLLVPILLYSPAAIFELATTPRPDWGPLLLGHGWRRCTWLVLELSLPIYLGMLWAFRRFAPTHLTEAGAVVGLTSAAASAVVYCLHCPTDTAVFAITWYTLAFVLAALLGSIIGRRLLRW